MKKLMKVFSTTNKKFLYQEILLTEHEDVESSDVNYENYTISMLELAKYVLIKKKQKIFNDAAKKFGGWENISESDARSVLKKIEIIDKKVEKIEFEIEKKKLKKLSEEINVEKLREASSKFTKIEQFMIKALKNTTIYKIYSLSMTDAQVKRTLESISYEINVMRKKFYSTKKICLPKIDELADYLKKELKGKVNALQLIVDKVIDQTIENFRSSKGVIVYNELVKLEREVKH